MSDIIKNAKKEKVKQDEKNKIITAYQTADLEKQEQVKHYAKTVIIDNGPQTPSELWHCVKILFGIEIPYTTTDPNFDPPFKWFSDVYFRKVSYSAAVASRGGGKTLLAGVLNYLWSIYHPKHNSRHAAATREQSDVISTYLRDFADDPVLGDKVVKNRVHTSQARFKNASYWKIVTGSARGVSGQHPSTLTLDEIEFWNVEAIEQSFRVPMERNGLGKVWSAFSTRQRSFGAMNWLIDNAEERGIKVYKWSVFEVMSPCQTCVAIDEHPHGTDEQRCQSCILWRDCRGERAKKATGFTTLTDAQEFKRSLGGDGSNGWETQGLCTRPSSSGLVLYNFEHKQKPDGNYFNWKYTRELPLYVTHDPAAGRKSALFFIQIHDNNIYIFDELVQSPCPDVTLTKEMFYEHCKENGYEDPKIIVVDPNRPDAMGTWKAGQPNGTGMAKKYNAYCPYQDKDHGGQKVAGGIEYLRSQIRRGNGECELFVNPNKCKNLITAIKEYHYPVDHNNKILSDEPVKDFSDEIDAIRYFVQFFKFELNRGGSWIHWIG